MRINRFIALATGLSRRTADKVIEESDVQVNGQPVQTGQDVTDADTVTLNGKILRAQTTKTILFNKPAGYICSRDGQGGRTIYDLLPPELHNLKPIGRLDKYSSGLLLLTNDGKLAQDLTHPSHQKNKIYEVKLDKDLQPLHRQMISDHGIQLEDGLSKFELERITDGSEKAWRITMHEGRNRQIRRTFEALSYHVKTLHRTQFGTYHLEMKPGEYTQV